MSDAPKFPEPSHQPEMEPTPDAGPAPEGSPAPEAEAAATEGAAPEGAATEGAATPTRSRGRIVGIVLAAVLGAVALLCAGTIVTGFFVYRQVSEPDRSTPGVVVRQYLQATFDDRDQAKAGRFTCGRPTDIVQVQQALVDLTGLERRFDIRITVGWENFTTEINKDSATVGTRLKVAVPEEGGQASESFQQWSFALRHGSGWRLCDAHRVS